MLPEAEEKLLEQASREIKRSKNRGRCLVKCLLRVVAPFVRWDGLDIATDPQCRRSDSQTLEHVLGCQDVVTWRNQVEARAVIP